MGSPVENPGREAWAPSAPIDLRNDFESAFLEKQMLCEPEEGSLHRFCVVWR